MMTEIKKDQVRTTFVILETNNVTEKICSKNVITDQQKKRTHEFVIIQKMTKKKEKILFKKMHTYARSCYVNFFEEKRIKEKEYPVVPYRNMSKNIKKNSKVYGRNYCFGSNCKRRLKLQILAKNTQVYLIVMRE